MVEGAVSRGVVIVVAVISIILYSCISDGPSSVEQVTEQAVPDIGIVDRGVEAEYYQPENPFTVSRLENVMTLSEVGEEIARWSEHGYGFTPKGSFVFKGHSSSGNVVITILCMNNLKDLNKDVLYIAHIDNGYESGITTGRILLDRLRPGKNYTAISDGVWFSPVGLPGPEGPIEESQKKWTWGQWWNCLWSAVAGSSAGCMVTCLPSYPYGYLPCYVTCVGGALIGAVVFCTIQEYFGGGVTDG
jgi:hypothetical protein